MTKTKLYDLPHEERSRLESEVKSRFDSDFNQIQIGLLKKANGDNIYELISRPSDKVIAKEWYDDQTEEDQKEVIADYRESKEDQSYEIDVESEDFLEWLYDEKQDDINEHFDEREWYPMWNTLFEARDSFMSEFLENHIDELYEIGIGVIQPTEDTNAMMFISGAGYSFYEAHWIPLYVDLLGWVEVNKPNA